MNRVRMRQTLEKKKPAQIVLRKPRRWFPLLLTAATSLSLAALAVLSMARAEEAPATPPRQLTLRDEGATAEQLAAMSDDELGKLDPIYVNLTVAKGIPGLGSLDVKRYQAQADRWAAEIQKAQNATEPYERDSPT